MCLVMVSKKVFIALLSCVSSKDLSVVYMAYTSPRYSLTATLWCRLGWEGESDLKLHSKQGIEPRFCCSNSNILFAAPHWLSPKSCLGKDVINDLPQSTAWLFGRGFHIFMCCLSPTTRQQDSILDVYDQVIDVPISWLHAVQFCAYFLISASHIFVPPPHTHIHPEE